MADGPKIKLADLDSTPVLLSQAKRGDTLAARQLLLSTARLISQGQPLPKELAIWIGRAIQGVAEGEDASAVFHLKKPRGKPQQLSDEMELFVAQSIHYSKAGLHKGTNADGSNRGAYLEAAEDFGISENTAEKIYQKYKAQIIYEDRLKREFDADSGND
jgi:hypothetical protein